MLIRVKHNKAARVTRVGGIDEVFVTIEGQRQERWRTVDQDGDSIDILVQRRRKRRSHAHAR
ncbi:MAG: DDE-type integrase/transposase/recombinase [Nitrospirota bacterium]|nr:DDE-type integrase/transposase/recombinase [Nitrospirota bacterium]MDH5698579.1 DDE-type integrase/transposase/recombinase [Nitrospirota bacterium]